MQILTTISKMITSQTISQPGKIDPEILILHLSNLFLKGNINK